MDSSGTIYRECEKCGELVTHDRDCPKCGKPSGTAKALAELLENAIKDEVPDPLARIRENLISEHARRQRAFKKARKPTPKAEG